MGQGKFNYETKIDKEFEEVWTFFSTADNLAKITSFPKVRILSDPSTTPGNTIKMQFNFFIFRISWHSKITKKEQTYFIDEGEKLPFPFKEWKHTHKFKEDGKLTVMTDIVEYDASVPDFFVKFILNQMFSGREKEIKKYFQKAK